MKKIFLCLIPLLAVIVITAGIYLFAENKDYRPIVEIASSYSNTSKDEAEKIAANFIEDSEYKKSFSEINASYMSDKTWLVQFIDNSNTLDDGITVTVDDNTQKVLKVQDGYSKPIEIK